MPLVLRHYQEAALTALNAYFARARGNPLIVAPTASGKSAMIAEFCRRTLTAWPDVTVLMLTHVRELIQQNADELRGLWPEAPLGIYSAGLGLRQVRPITFGGIQSIYDQAHKLGHVDLVIVDEAHLVPASGEGMYRTLIADLQKTNPKVKVIGFTATPFRTDSGRLTDAGGIFTDIAYDIDLLQLIEQKFLCRLVSRGVKQEAVIDASGVPIRAGEFARDILENLALDTVKQAVAECIRLGVYRKSWLVFACGVDHGFEVASQLGDQGIQARMVAGDTPKEQRDEIIADFKAGRLRCLVNANVLTVGFNAPNIDLIAILRATQSPGLLVQMCGRGMRIAEGKEDCLVLDFGENFERHGPINAIRPRRRRADGSMDRPEPVAPRLCFTCGHQEVVRSDKCENCGTPWPVAMPSHGTQASTKAPIAETKTFAVLDFGAALHHKKDKPVSLVVSYRTIEGWVDEWVCLEHTGYARQKAAMWWQRRGQPPVPETVDEALQRLSELRVPKEIRVGQEGRFFKVLGYFWHTDAEEEARHRESLSVRRAIQENEDYADEVPF
jgi:DNA repair protein RadD